MNCVLPCVEVVELPVRPVDVEDACEVVLEGVLPVVEPALLVTEPVELTVLVDCCDVDETRLEDTSVLVDSVLPLVVNVDSLVIDD